MNTKTGYIGSIDWNYDFQSHGWDQNGSCSPERIKDQVNWLRQLDGTNGGNFMASTYTGWPRIWQKVLSTGMYVGWPYWHPIPSVLLDGPLGPEWHSFLAITDIYERTN